MKRILILLITLLPLATNAAVKITSIKKVADGLYLMYYDTTREKHIVTKSTIVEFKDHIVLIEMPISNDGAGTVHLSDHSEDGEVVLQKLKEQFPGKPLKYVLSTHWHPHSISSVIPFISKGIIVYTTKNNYKRISEYIDSNTYRKYGKNIRYIDHDGTILKDKTNEITAYLLNKKDYPNIPTEDFVFYYLPRYKCMHSSCMYQRLDGYMVGGKEMISSRVEDLHKLTGEKNIVPASYITTDTYWDEPSGLVLQDTMNKMYATGITMGELSNNFLLLDEQTITLKSDSILKMMMTNGIPSSILNNAVYICLQKKALTKALALARLQALANPSNPNSWDTFGEVYYLMGDLQMAKKYDVHTHRINKDFGGGMDTWESDKKDFMSTWANNGLN